MQDVIANHSIPENFSCFTFSGLTFHVFPLSVSLLIPFFMGVWKQLSEYLYLRKPDPDRPKTKFVKYMHGINRLSLLLFIVAMIVLFIRLTFKR